MVRQVGTNFRRQTAGSWTKRENIREAVMKNPMKIGETRAYWPKMEAIGGARKGRTSRH